MFETFDHNVQKKTIFQIIYKLFALIDANHDYKNDEMN